MHFFDYTHLFYLNYTQLNLKETGMNRFKNFSESGSKVITAALNIAGKMGHITVGTEHLLMGILTSGKTDSADLLCQWDINFACVYNVVLNILGAGQQAKLTEDDFGTNAVLVLKTACRISAQNGKLNAGANEILSAICYTQNCLAYHILTTLTKEDATFFAKANRLCRRKNTAEFSSVNKQKKEMKILEKYSKNLTLRAKLTPFDPCIGREKEIRQLVEILLRRNKNNPCLVGLAGVGKTAIVEGLANMIVDGNVPQQMKSKSIYSIDIARLLAGTKYRGDFEERVKSLIDEAAGDRDIILFIDEIHTIVSAGGAEGAIDAANILKPALARGTIQVIGATTRDEYSQTIEKDAALERRFCPVDIQEPDYNGAVNILQGLKSRYEEYHGIAIENDAITACVELSVKHIHNRFLPDKAVDLLDQSCASARVEGKTALSAGDVAVVISRQKGINIEEKDSITHLETQLNSRIIGQEKAVKSMSSALKRRQVGFKKDSAPIATFMFCGPTGVGKTHSCQVLADVLFPGQNALVRIDCSEYSDKNDISKLIGSPPGYVGYDDGGRFEKEICAHDSCVVLFDEIEKAHRDLHNLLLQTMDNGFVTTSRGKKISFRNCIIVFTSNAAANLSEKQTALGFEKLTASSVDDSALHSALNTVFSKEFLGRINQTVYFDKLDDTSVKQLVTNFLQSTIKLMVHKGITLSIDPTAIDFICKASNSALYGARNIRSAIAALVETPVSDMLVSRQLAAGMQAVIAAEDTIKIKINQPI